MKKSPYLCKTKEIDNDSDTNLKKVEKRFGRLKNSSYLCETKIKWSVRLLDRTGFFSEIKQRFESSTDYKYGPFVYRTRKRNRFICLGRLTFRLENRVFESSTGYKISRGRAVVARKAHNLEVIGSSPVPATKKEK